MKTRNEPVRLFDSAHLEMTTQADIIPFYNALIGGKN
ncbi:hypothetical protein J2766_003769 [Agrobacterium tumefaciens]|uniref:Uncharacterized protein n=1 Tax=Agrobacterium tumefaciens TaxID=358 RepID=A0AAW8LP32_AGRTU|nr:hypothetical protein [Agrobacterium tumefaciens]MDR6700368.1 hypothetical protein [Agrobacterium tumefaciens]